MISAAVFALVIAVFASRNQYVAGKLPSFVTVLILGSLIFSVITFGMAYLLGGSVHIGLSELIVMMVLLAAFVALLALPVVLVFRVIFVTISSIFRFRNSTLK